MPDFWPWLAMVGMGVLHGLNPASGWILCSAWGATSQQKAQVLHAMLPLVLGHAASMALVLAMATFALPLLMQAMPIVAALRPAAVLALPSAAMLLAGLALYCRPRQSGAPAVNRLAFAGLGLWSFAVSCVQGAGLMLVPALAPLCLSGVSASASLGWALAAIAVHLAAMLAATCAGAVLGRRWIAAGSRLLQEFSARRLRAARPGRWRKA